MAKKMVSVRLVAQGGRQVRAEIEGIGKADTRGLGPTRLCPRPPAIILARSS